MVCKNCGQSFENGNFCPNCGSPAPVDDSVVCAECGNRFIGKFCPNCGRPAAVAETPSYKARQEQSTVNSGAVRATDSQVYRQAGLANVAAEPLIDKFKEVFSDGKFLTVAFLITLGTVLAFVTAYLGYNIDSSSGITLSVGSILAILYTIALWMIYATAKSKKRVFKTAGLKLASGTIKASYIVNWVVFGLLCCCVIILLVAVGWLEEIMYEIYGYSLDIEDAALYAVVAGFAVYTALFAIVNGCFVGKLHRFAKSLCVSAQTGIVQFVKVKASRCWLSIVGVIECIAAIISCAGYVVLILVFSNYFSFTIYTVLYLAAALISSLSTALAYITLSGWIKKYFTDC